MIEVVLSHSTDCTKIRLQSQSIRCRFVVGLAAVCGDVGTIKVFPIRNEIRVIL